MNALPDSGIQDRLQRLKGASLTIAGRLGTGLFRVNQ
jgi:hypothetical protein